MLSNLEDSKEKDVGNIPYSIKLDNKEQKEILNTYGHNKMRKRQREKNKQLALEIRENQKTGTERDMEH